MDNFIRRIFRFGKDRYETTRLSLSHFNDNEYHHHYYYHASSSLLSSTLNCYHNPHHTYPLSLSLSHLIANARFTIKHMYRNTREKELRHVEKSVGKVFMKLSANMAKEATKPELMRSGMLQTRGAFLRDRNSWRLSRVNVTNKYLQLENLEKGDSGVKRTRKFKFPHRTLKKNVRSFTRYIRITDTRYSQTNNR